MVDKVVCLLYYSRVMARKRSDKLWAACVGLAEIPSLNIRHECWNDLDIVDRKWPIHLRYLPSKWVTFDRNGAILKNPWRSHSKWLKNLTYESLDKVTKPY
jgi:hypothetical protein